MKVMSYSVCRHVSHLFDNCCEQIMIISSVIAHGWLQSVFLWTISFPVVFHSNLKFVPKLRKYTLRHTKNNLANCLVMHFYYSWPIAIQAIYSLNNDSAQNISVKKNVQKLVLNSAKYSQSTVISLELGKLCFLISDDVLRKNIIHLMFLKHWTWIH